MKKMILSLVLLSSFTFGAWAQSQKDVEKLLAEYKAAMQQREWLKSLDYIYPALFDVVPREMMEETLVQSFNSPELEISFEEMELLEVSEVYKEDGLNYSFADYSLVMSMKLAGEKSDEEIQQFADLMAAQLGEENINVKDKVIFITQNNSMAVIKNDDQEKLYLLELNPQLKEIIASFMSDTFMERAFADS